jgi:type II secretory pathway pseudopilin PulG
MKQKRTGRIRAPLQDTRNRRHEGFSIVEMLVALCIFLPLMIGAAQLFEVGVKQKSREQSTLEASMDATIGFQMMLSEIAQAGSHSDISTTLQQNVSGSATAQAVSVASTAGLNPGDYIDIVDSTGSSETIEIKAVGDGTLTAIILGDYTTGDDVRLFAQPYTGGIISPTALAANASTDVTTLRFFGDIYGDGNLYYVEYAYDSNNAQITRSITRFDAGSKSAAVPLISHIQQGSAQFTLHADGNGVVSSVTASLTVENQWKNDAGQLEEIRLSSRVNAPSIEAASALYYESMHYGGVANLPSIPSFVASLRESLN